MAEERRIVHLTPAGNPVKHGGSGTAYVNYGCRCWECTAANTERVTRRRKQREKVTPGSDVEHGTASTYSNWGCRCAPCGEAWSLSCRLYRQRVRNAGAAVREGVPEVDAIISESILGSSRKSERV